MLRTSAARILWLAVALMIGGAGCATVLPAGPRSPARQRLWARPNVVIRVFGQGSLPELHEPVTYDLCVDRRTGRLRDVHLPGKPVDWDDAFAIALRKWRWGVVTSLPVSGVNCWRERFGPAYDEEDGELGVRAEPALPLRYFSAGKWWDQVSDVPDPEDGDETLAAVNVSETDGVRYVLAVPQLTVEDSSPFASAEATPAGEPKLVKGELPHLPRWLGPRYRNTALQVVYSVCVDLKGKVDSVAPIVPILGANGVLMDALRSWQFAPPEEPMCRRFRFVYNIF
jgi:hypothetical protein